MKTFENWIVQMCERLGLDGSGDVDFHELLEYGAAARRRTYVTGTGDVLVGVHKRTSGCSKYGCVVHSPSQHCMLSFPTHWRPDRGLMERICPHGIGHPDPDHLSYVLRTYGADDEGVHGCDGCCSDTGPVA